MVSGWGQGTPSSGAYAVGPCFNVQVAQMVMVGLEKKEAEWKAFQRRSTMDL